MSDRTRPWEFTADVMSGLSHWWQRLTTHEDDYSMTGDIYEDIVARSVHVINQTETNTINHEKKL